MDYLLKKGEVEKSLDEILNDLSQGKPLTGFEDKELSFEDRETLDEIAEVLVSIGFPSSFLDRGVNESKWRVIGAYLAREYGMVGMKYVAENNREYLPFIERAWDGIGSWQS